MSSTSLSSSTSVENNIVSSNHHYYLGGSNYVNVTYFNSTTLIHLRTYLQDKNGKLFPTRKGITLTTSLWTSLMKNSENYLESALAGKVIVVNDGLLIAKADLNNGPHITFQRYFKRRDLSRKFCDSMYALAEQDFVRLLSDRDLQRQVSSSVIREIYSHEFPQTVLKEIEKHAKPSTSSKLDPCDIEMVLTTSMVELLKSHIGENVASTFRCIGCEENYENQLGHECITYSYGEKLFICGHIAILDINLEQLSRNFVEMNAQIVNHINSDFFSKVDGTMLVQNAKEMYIASDPIPLRMF